VNWSDHNGDSGAVGLIVNWSDHNGDSNAVGLIMSELKRPQR